jgi:hypothetical protein
MTTPPDAERPRLYAILTVCLPDGAKPANDREAYDALKAGLGLANPVIDDVYGAMPVAKTAPWMADDLPKNSYLVLVSGPDVWRLIKEKHPNVLGMHHAAAVHSGKGPQPLSPSDVAKIMGHRRPKGPGR